MHPILKMRAGVVAVHRRLVTPVSHKDKTVPVLQILMQVVAEVVVPGTAFRDTKNGFDV